MFSSFLNAHEDQQEDDSSVESVVQEVGQAAAPFSSSFFGTLNDETPGTLAYFKAFKDHLESKLRFPATEKLPSVWKTSLEASQTARQSFLQATKVLEELQKQNSDKATPPVPAAQIAQAQKAVDQAQVTLDECNKTVQLLAQELLTSSTSNDDNDDDDSPCIAQFLSEDFDDSAWVTFMVLQDPNHWANWCCPNKVDQPCGKRVAAAMSFLLDVETQRRILGAGGGGPRHGNYGGYLEILQQLDSSAAYKEPVIERLAQAVALELADRDLCYFDTTKPLDPVARFLHYEQAYLMGDLDMDFSTLDIWELRLAIKNPQQEWEFQWGRECLQTYRPDWALTDDQQWKYCRLVRLDVGYMQPTYTSYPRTMDQVLSGGGECGPRAWFGRFMCNSFGIPTWGYKQVGHAAMSHWSQVGWLSCLGAGFVAAFWEDRCGLDFYLETQARGQLPSALAYLQKVMRLEWLAVYQKESNASFFQNCAYDPAAPWYALSLAQRNLLASPPKTAARRYQHFPRSTRTVPKILALQESLSTCPGKPTLRLGQVCIPADATVTEPSDKIIIMPSFSGGRQVFLGTDATLEYKLETHWLPIVERKYRLTLKVATAHVKDVALHVSVNSTISSASDSYRLPLPYTKGLWEETSSIVVSLNPSCGSITLQREWMEMYGISLKEIRLLPCE